MKCTEQEFKPFQSLQLTSEFLNRRCSASLAGERVFPTIDFGGLHKSKFKEAIWDALGQIRSQVGSDWDIFKYSGFAELVALEAYLERGDAISPIDYAHDNFDTGGGGYFIEPLSAFLLATGKTQHLARLWKGVVGIRTGYVREEFEGRPEGFRSERADLNELWDGALTAIDRFIGILRATGQEDEMHRAELFRAEFIANKRRRAKPTSDARRIDEGLFWGLIQEARADLDYPAQVAERLAGRLEDFGLAQIRNFKRILELKLAESYRNDLWAVAYIVRGGCGDDEFDYFRAWLVAAGREVFEAALVDPRSIDRALQPGEDPQLEGMLYVADIAYENKKGEPLHGIKVPKLKLKGGRWEEKDLPTLYPELSAIYGSPG